jgi:hypothetical protein
MKINLNGAVVYEGKSMFDDKPIVAIATGFLQTYNRKLGSNVIQLWIMPRDVLPNIAIQEGKDVSVCGDCSFRKGICYVNIAIINSIYLCYQRGGYELIQQKHYDIIRNYRKVLRLTAYGDIASLPHSAWIPLEQAAKHTVGYTQQWESLQAYRGMLMASVKSVNEANIAQENGWKTYRVKSETEPLDYNEILCSNSVNKTVQCQTCGLCDGRSENIAVDVHGTQPKINNFNKFKMN